MSTAYLASTDAQAVLRRRAANLRALIEGTHPGLVVQARTARSVVDACDMAPTYIYEVLAARRPLSLRMVDRFAPVFGTTPAQFLGLLDDLRATPLPLTIMEASS